jgi:formylglycine-generating enzyme required for sulfatase activity
MPAVLRSIILSIAFFGASTWVFPINLVAGRSGPSCDGIEILVNSLRRCLRPMDSFKDCPECPEMVILPGGEFQMGSGEQEAERSDSEGPQHTVKISRPFAIGKYEVTFAEWDACVAGGGCRYRPRDSGWGRNRRPVINVSWDDAMKEYLPWVSKKTGQAYRLLTEAEWEYAARADTATPFATGSTVTTKDANFDGTNTYGGSAKGEYRQRTLEVGSFPSNAFGLHDMHGNVWEWVADCYVDTYVNAPSDGSASAEVPNCNRVMRGGSWIDSPRVLRSAYRGFVPSNTRFIYRGFRVARVL